MKFSHFAPAMETYRKNKPPLFLIGPIDTRPRPSSRSALLRSDDAAVRDLPGQPLFGLLPCGGVSVRGLSSSGEVRDFLAGALGRWLTRLAKTEQAASGRNLREWLNVAHRKAELPPAGNHDPWEDSFLSGLAG